MKKLIDRLRKISIPWYLTNKYTITLILLLGWVFFFDGFDLITVAKMRYEIRQKEKEIEQLDAMIDQDRKHYHELTSDPELLEKFAREEYLMKKENEEIFVILRDESDSK